MGGACPRDPAKADLDSGRCGCHLSARACGQCSRHAASGASPYCPVRAAHGLRTSQRQAAAPCTRVPDAAKAVAAPCARVSPCPSVDPQGIPELKQQILGDGRSSESPDGLALTSLSAAAASGGSQMAGRSDPPAATGQVVFVREGQDFQEGEFVTVFIPQGGKGIGRILSRSGDMSASSTSVSVQLMALQDQVPSHALRAEEKRLGVRLLGAEREIFFTRSVQVTAPTSILGEKLPVSVVPADLDNPEDAGSHLDLVPPMAMLARFVLNSTEPVTLSHLSSHDILLPVTGHPDTERKDDAGKMMVPVDTGGRDMSLNSQAPTRDQTLAQRRAPPLCNGLRVRCVGGAPSFTFDPHSFFKHQQKIRSSAFAALVSVQAKILTQPALLCYAACPCPVPVPRRTTLLASRFICLAVAGRGAPLGLPLHSVNHRDRGAAISSQDVGGVAVAFPQRHTHPDHGQSGQDNPNSHARQDQ